MVFKKKVVFSTYWCNWHNDLWKSPVSSLGNPWSIWCHCLWVHSFQTVMPFKVVQSLVTSHQSSEVTNHQGENKGGKRIFIIQDSGLDTLWALFHLIHPRPCKVIYNPNCTDEESAIKWRSHFSRAVWVCICLYTHLRNLIQRFYDHCLIV